MAKNNEISASISEETSDLLNQYVKATGVRKGHVIELALRYHCARCTIQAACWRR